MERTPGSRELLALLAEPDRLRAVAKAAEDSGVALRLDRPGRLVRRAEDVARLSKLVVELEWALLNEARPRREDLGRGGGHAPV